MSKLDLIILIDIMCGLSSEEYECLKNKDINEIEKVYRNVYQKQDDEQIQICYF
ncbi:conserved hypothetical protein [Staphylococcus capitis]|nr:conserved hypothetical protein [Staphylococcus capitis]